MTEGLSTIGFTFQHNPDVLLLDRRMNPKIAEEHAVRPYMAAQSRISEFAKSHELKSRPHAMLWLSKVYGIPAGMYAS